MGIIKYKDIAYGGGSNVEPNPQDTASGNLTKVGIDGDVYDIKDANAAPNIPTFSEASTRANLSGSGENMATILGKIKKWFTDLKDLAFIGKDGTSSTKYLRGDGTWQAFPDLNGEKSVTGNPITIADGSESYASELKVEIKPIQSGSGTPSPQNVRPISGISECSVESVGKNKLPMTVAGVKAKNTNGIWSGNTYTLNSVTFTIVTDTDNNITGINVNGTASANTTFTVYSTREESFPYNGYLLSGCPSGSSSTYDLRIADGGSTTIANYSGDTEVNLTDSGIWSVQILVRSGKQASNVLYKPMIRQSSITDATFAPYKYSNATITLGQTVYGGVVDVLNGTLTITDKILELGGSTFGWGTYDSGKKIWYSDVLSNSTRYSGICDSYLSTNKAPANLNDGEYCLYTNNRFYIRDTNYTGNAAFKTHLTNDNVCATYKLATPITLNLTPAELKLLKDQNNITTNGYSISMTYQPQNVLGDVLESAEEYTDRAMLKVNGWTLWETVTGLTASAAAEYNNPISGDFREVLFVGYTNNSNMVASIFPYSLLSNSTYQYIYAGTAYLKATRQDVIESANGAFSKMEIYVR